VGCCFPLLLLLLMMMMMAMAMMAMVMVVSGWLPGGVIRTLRRG
jgi:hypothetical protein